MPRCEVKQVKSSQVKSSRRNPLKFAISVTRTTTSPVETYMYRGGRRLRLAVDVTILLLTQGPVSWPVYEQ
jgi:hypothetical protein